MQGCRARSPLRSWGWNSPALLLISLDWMVITMTLWRQQFMTIVVMLIWCSAALATGEHAKPVKVKACREASRLPPITRRCVAAAIAEYAYLNAAVHSLDFLATKLTRPDVFASGRSGWNQTAPCANCLRSPDARSKTTSVGKDVEDSERTAG